MLQVTTQQGMAAGLQADQTAKLIHIDSLKATVTEVQVQLGEQQRQTATAEEACATLQHEVTRYEAAMAGEE